MQNVHCSEKLRGFWCVLLMQCVSLVNLPENRGVLLSELIPQKVLEWIEIENLIKNHVFVAFIGSELRGG